MDFEVWVLFLFSYLAITLVPGPNVLLVLKNSYQFGYFAAALTIFGNLFCQLLIIMAISFGTGALLVSFPKVFLIYKIIGGGYLVYLGIKMIMSKTNDQALGNKFGEAVKRPSNFSIIANAFVISLANPKTVIFLSAFLPQFINSSTSLPLQFSTMFLTISMIVSAVHLSYCLVSAVFAKRFATPWLKTLLSKLAGIAFISFGGRIIVGRNP